MQKIVEPWIEALGMEREAALDKIGRYNMYRFNYRTSIADHARRVAWMYLEVWPIFLHLGLVFSKGYVLARTHDDPEIDPNLLDVQAGHKAVMGEHDKNLLETKELAAIEYVAERFGPKVGPYIYRDVLIEAKDRQTREAQLIKLIDKYDAYCEAIHELRAGNVDVTINKTSAFGEPAPVPFELYPKLTRKLANESEMLKGLFEQSTHPFLSPIDPIDFRSIAASGQMHTADSVRIPTGISAYDAWIEMIFKYSHDEPTWLWNLNTNQYANCCL